MAPLQPQEVLFADGARELPLMASCEHYAGSERFLRKALELQAQLGGVFDVTVDCEDGARAGAEREQIELALALLHDPLNRHGRLGVRVHGYHDAPWRQDVDLLLAGAAAELAYLTLPKATSVAQVATMAAYIRSACDRQGERRTPPLHVLIETQGALRDVWKIAAIPGVEVLDFGLMDFVSDHQGAIPETAMRSPEQFEHRLVTRAKTEVVAAALAHGIVPAHNVTLALKDAEQTRADAERARREFGFLRMWSIYPTQVEAILAGMAPDLSRLPRALALLSQAQDAGWGPVAFEGQLQDRGTYRDAWRLVRQARAGGLALGAEAERRFFGG
ncbi:MAG: CoA ester lyase [Proteobacteria bacterium]|nr:CoA ester lyase [Pseudomonadota bacterium]